VRFIRPAWADASVLEVTLATLACSKMYEPTEPASLPLRALPERAVKPRPYSDSATDWLALARPYHSGV
jgi:hypothetical protein